MRRYLYVFGYCTPGQWLANKEHGWDDEDSCAFFIEADSEEKALDWGRQVSELLVGRLFEKDPRFNKTLSWKEADFANWIEHKPLARFSGLALEMLPVVKVGEVPELRLG